MLDFNKVYSSPITRELVLSKVQESDIFYNYFGNFDLKKIYKSVFRKDNNPSTGFYINKKGKLIYNDLKTGEKLDCFAFVSKLYNITYYEAIRKVAADFGIIGQSKIFEKKYNKELDLETKSKTIIQFVPDAWNYENLLFWKKYEITQDELERENVYPIKELFINKRKIYGNEQRYALVESYEDNTYVKIYSPFDKKMKWVSNIPLYVPFGLESLPYKSDTLIITKSKKDQIVLKKIFTDVIATQNESVSALCEKDRNLILSMYKNPIIFWDNDATGVENCTEMNKFGFGYINIPKIEYEKYKIKDASDYILHYGLDSLKEFINEKIGFKK